MEQDPLEVGVAPAIFPCIFIPPSIVEPFLIEAKYITLAFHPNTLILKEFI